MRPLLPACAVLLAWLCASAMAAGEIEAANAAYAAGQHEAAARLYTPLAEAGHAEAQMKLGMLYQFGQGVPRDYQQALQWYDKAAAQGNEESKLRLDNLKKRLDINASRDQNIAREAAYENRDGRLSGALSSFAGQFAQGMANNAPLINSMAPSQARAPALPAAVAGAGVTSCPVGFHLFMPYGRAGVCQPNAQGSAAPINNGPSTITGVGTH